MSLRDLSPWDMMPYLAAPVMSAPSLTGGTAKQILTSDPQRILVAFSSAATVAIGTDSTVTVSLNTLKGFQMTSGQFPIILTAWDHGPIVCGEWWAFSAQTTGQLSVFSQSLLRWPQPGDTVAHNAIIGSRQPRLPPNRIDPSPGVGGKRNILDYWLSLISRLTGGR